VVISCWAEFRDKDPQIPTPNRSDLEYNPQKRFKRMDANYVNVWRWGASW